MKDEEALREVVNRLKSRLDLKAVILFGSRARGDWKPWSDYDLLIIADFKEKYLDRIKTIYDIIADIPLEIEPHPYTLNEALMMLKKGNPIIIDALDYGVVLYKTEDVEVLYREFQRLKEKGLKRTETTIILPHDSSFNTTTMS